jgi:predicted helicase
MANGLRDLLATYRAQAASEREKGAYFERLVKIWLENAPTQRDQFARVLTYADFAAEQRLPRNDAGIDLVAQLADSPDDWCAIQCKFYAHGHRIQKADIDSFFTASGKRPFTRRLIVDTTGAPWSQNADDALHGQVIPVNRVGLSDLDESGIDWAAFAKDGTVHVVKKSPRPHQLEALKAVREGLAEADRGKLIMACGTGKTYTGLLVAQEIAGRGGRVLFLAPSLALLSQTIREWSIDATIALRSFAVCSDAQVGVRKGKDDDLADLDMSDLELPATTMPGRLAAKATKPAPDRMTVVFSTYQSLEAVAQAQAKFGLPDFDLIICDEAHRTTGATLAGEDESAFVKVHDPAFIRGAKRLYMTATPRIYGEAVKSKAKDVDATLASMDDEDLFGKVLFTRNFGWAVQNGLLTDYKVIILAVDEGDVAASLQARISDGANELRLDDATRMVGCYKALTKADLKIDAGSDPAPMRRALAFCKSIATSKIVEEQFAAVAADWRAALPPEKAEGLPPLACEVRHVDGTFQANAKNERLAWLKEEAGEGVCRILTNARCLSEGVDVPALDAVLFLHPRKSKIDVVQSVGRVMRRAEGKKMGYVILPIGVPPGVAPEEALNDNARYAIVWDVLNALRSHDERLDADINKAEFLGRFGDRIEVQAVVSKLPETRAPKGKSGDFGAGAGGPSEEEDGAPSAGAIRLPKQIAFEFDEFSRAILARIVKKCGTRAYWENWAADVARIAQVHITRIKAAVAAADSEEKAAFDTFLAEIRDDLNDAITEDEAVEMLAQHLITRPVFDALFEGYAFADRNPVSRALEGVLAVLDRQNLQKEAESLERFYQSVRVRAAGIDDAAAKQKIIVELYDNFFKAAFPKLTQRMGIVYTPVEIVDFILRSVEEVLGEEFGQSISDEGVHVIDPFTGTGTFITRLLQSGLIRPEDMARKFAHEIHANEIVLLAYYIAAINIEAVYHDRTGAYEPFPGICLTDTFQLYERDDLVAGMMADNSGRRTRQKSLPIKVIVGNPPYSAKQKSENDNAANVVYPSLDARIESTFAKRGSATNKNALYDSYIRAIRWGADRLAASGGVLAFVTNAGWLEGSSTDGLRKCLADEFTRIDVFHLRGNQRTQGEQSRREGGKVFGQGSRTPVAITVMAINPASAERGRIRFHDVGDYLSREEKLAKVKGFASLSGVTRAGGWQAITPDEHGDWLKQRDDSFASFIAIGDKNGGSKQVLFATYSMGLKTARDAWAVNPSRMGLLANMRAMIAAYEEERARFAALGKAFESSAARDTFVDGFVSTDPARISWSANLKSDLGKDTAIGFQAGKAVLITYRPFAPQWLYFDRKLNERVYQMPRLFPGAGLGNLVICIPARCGAGEFSALATMLMPDINFAPGMGGYQAFPRYIYTPAAAPAPDGDLFADAPADPAAPAFVRTDAITDAGLKHFTDAYPGEAISKDDVFDYVYGVLHHPTYRDRYADNLTKELPRIPLMATAAAFRAIVEAGRALGDLHVNYDAVEPYPLTIREGDLRLANIPDPVSYFRVEKMKFAGKRGATDKSVVIYNPRITLENIPLRAYDYVANGKPALEWVMERQCVKVDPASGIVSDANAYANETVGDPRYPLLLFQRVVTVSLRTLDIIEALPPFEIREG